MKKLLIVLPFFAVACAPVSQDRTSERVSELEIKITRIEQRQVELEKDLEETNRRIDRLTEILSEIRLDFERLKLRIETGVAERESRETARLPEKEDVRKVPPPGDIQVIRPGEIQKEEAKPEVKDEETAYREAIELYSVKKLYEARDAFLNFIKHHPQSKYTDNAFFWIGKIYYELGDMGRAESVFKSLVEKCEGGRLPDCNKLPDAYFQLMKINMDRGNMDEANRYYTILIDKFPTSDAAVRAREHKNLLGE
ncbi:MAG: tetratricopeptide repeat protein [Aquificota bacterium]|nr:tetratricopeptide repeat protein [Aquificota bacterium]